jgi:aspartyl-tRNA(Asn)/glutamyl-tRNA(Gln) amidotransferase subunit B
MRIKEGSDDYRYFPEPDLVTYYIDEDWKSRIRSLIPELPDARKKRYIEDFGLSEYDASVLVQSKAIADFFQETVEAGADSKLTANWLMGEVSGYLNNNDMDIEETALTPQSLAKLIELIEKGTISSKIAKQVFADVMEQGGDPEQIVKDKGLMQISDEGELKQVVDGILDNNPQSIEDYKNGKDKALGFLVGQVMKETKGKANPQMVNSLILEGMEQR